MSIAKIVADMNVELAERDEQIEALQERLAEIKTLLKEASHYTGSCEGNERRNFSGRTAYFSQSHCYAHIKSLIDKCMAKTEL